MKIKIYLTLLLTALLIVSCYQDLGVVNSFIAEKNDFHFNAKGGTETVNLLRRGSKKIRQKEIDWDYMGCSSPKKDLNQFKVKMQVDTLADGSVKDTQRMDHVFFA